MLTLSARVNMPAPHIMEPAMYTLADLNSQDSHIRSCEAFIENQRRIIAAQAAQGEPTEKAEHWLSIFLDGLARHRRRRSEIFDLLLAVEATKASRPISVDQSASCIGEPGDVGRAILMKPAPRIVFERRRAQAGNRRR